MVTDEVRKGRKGEDLALEWLLQQGYSFLERNYRVGHREIDIIVESAEKVHIVEVKSETFPILVDPCEKVDARKQRFLASAAAYYVRKAGVTKEIQFDVITVIFKGDTFLLEYIPDAFIPVYHNRHFSL